MPDPKIPANRNGQLVSPAPWKVISKCSQEGSHTHAPSYFVLPERTTCPLQLPRSFLAPHPAPTYSSSLRCFLLNLHKAFRISSSYAISATYFPLSPISCRTRLSLAYNSTARFPSPSPPEKLEIVAVTWTAAELVWDPILAFTRTED